MSFSVILSRYILLVSNITHALDQCVLCSVGTYLLDEVVSPDIACKPCLVGAQCPGGIVVNGIPGYRRAPFNLRRVAFASLAQAKIYQCPVGVCGNNNSCNNNRIGVISIHLIFLNLNQTDQGNGAGLLALSKWMGIYILML